MKTPTLEEQKALVRLWESTGPELERIRRQELKGMPYNWRDVDALLGTVDHLDLAPRLTSGLVEMEEWFMRAARRGS